MIVLAIESSCDESCAAVLDTETWTLLSDVVHSHIPAMKQYGGIVPEIASRAHLTALPQVVGHALEAAGKNLRQIDHIAVSNRPGLIGALLVGLNYAKGLAWSLGVPFSVHDHIEAHLYSPFLAEVTGNSGPPPFPWVAAVVSGGHTELFYVPSFGAHRWLGGTLDDAAGEAFDKIGKILGLGYPAGPVIDRLVREHREALRGQPSVVFPVARVADYHFSFSGLKSAVALAVESHRRDTADNESPPVSLLAAAQEAILTPIVQQIRKGLTAFPGANPVLTGGVACNSRLRELLPEAHFPIPRHCSDNAAMVAVLAGLKNREHALVASPWSEGASPRSEWLGLGASS